MRTNPIPPQILQPLTVALPWATFAVCFAILLPLYLGLKEDQRQAAKIQELIQQRQHSMSLIQSGGNGTVIARVPSSPDEPVLFLRNLNEVASSARVRIKELKEAAPDDIASLNSGASPKDPVMQALPPGTVQNALQITVEGPYSAIIRFFARLETYPRLISLSNVRIHVDKTSLLTAQIQLTRYTGPAEEARPGITGLPSAFASARSSILKGPVTPPKRQPAPAGQPR